MSRIILPESKLRARRRRHRRITLLLCVVFLFVCFGLSIWASWAKSLQVKEVLVTGTGALEPQTLIDLAAREMTGKYYHLFSKGNIFLYPKDKIRTDIVAQYPVVQGVDVRASNFHSISIAVVERQPKALWCGADTSASSTCFLMDANGLAYAEAPEASKAVFKRYFGALALGSLPRQYVSADMFRSLSALVDALEKRQTPDSVTAIFVDPNNDARVTFASGFVLIFPAGGDGGDVYDRFGLALQTNPFTDHPVSDFEYLDLRFGDHLYFKLKPGTVSTSTR